MPTRYELFFLSSGPEAPDRASFERYFSGRENFTLTRGHARYANEDTGVAFSFEVPLEQVQGPPDRPRTWARFTLDFVRPSFFAEEATKELEAFTERFGGSVMDPGAPSFTSYGTPAFLRSWESGNRVACGPYRGASPGGPFTMSRSRLLAVWQWNYRRKELQEQEGDGLFVPRIWFIRSDAGVSTGVIWPDAMAIRAPQVDVVIFSRDALAPRGRLGRRPDVAVAPWSAIASSITGNAFYDSPLVSWRITNDQVLIGLAQMVSTLRGAEHMPEMVPPEKVLDREGFASEPTARPTRD